MSRAYRIRVSESLRRVIRARDHVSTQLELLEILPAEEMAGLLTEALVAEGFEETKKGLVRSDGGVTVRIDARSGTVTVESEASERVELKSERRMWGDADRARDDRKSVEQRLREELQEELQQDAKRKEEALQQAVTERLERRLADVQGSLGRVVNRVTAEALKRRAAQLGEIKQLTEDPESGSMTIVLEV